MNRVSLLARVLFTLVIVVSLVPNETSLAARTDISMPEAPGLTQFRNVIQPNGQILIRKTVLDKAPDQANNAACNTAMSPTLISPLIHSSVGTLSPELTWKTIIGITDYALQISKVPDFSSLTYATIWYVGTMSQVTYSPYFNLEPNTKYYWRVSANCSGAPFASSDFTVGNVPNSFISPPDILFPTEGAKLVNGSFLASWANVSGATGVQRTYYSSYYDFAKGHFSLKGYSSGWYGSIFENLDWLAPGTLYMTVQVRNQYGWGPAKYIPRTFSIGKYASDLGFRPNPNGYIFKNFGNTGNWLALNEFSESDMVAMFGRIKVCQLTNPNCVPNAAALWWLEKVNFALRDGHCLGMSSTTLNFYKNPSQIGLVKSGASTAYQLQQSLVQSQIVHDAVLQATLPLRTDIQTAYAAMTPKNVAAILQSSFNSGGSDPYVLMMKKTNSKSAHAIVPYAVSQISANELHVFVYDNNFPNETAAYVLINPTDAGNTWQYIYPDGSASDWLGDSSSHNLALISLSKIKQTPTDYPFNNSSAMAASTLTGETEVWSYGFQNMWVSNGSGQRMGYIANTLVNEIPGGNLIPFLGGLNSESLPYYELPSGGSYTIHLDGDGDTLVTDGFISQNGSGFFAQAGGITLSNSAHDTLNIDQGGSQVTYTASETHTVDLKITADLSDGTGSLSASDLPLTSGKSESLISNPANHEFELGGSQSASGNYILNLHIRTSAGDRWFYNPAVSLMAGDTQIISYDGWNGGDLTISIDHGSDGSVDETLVLTNHVTTVFLPFISR